MKKHLPLLFAWILCIGANAQTNSWTVVYNIFQAKCTSCHSGGSPAGQLNLGASSSAVYTALINKTPVNPTAVARADKLVLPGDGHRSFLLRKVQNGLDYDNGIVPAEGVAMPKDNTPLSNIEIETIRQWILYGAKQTGVAVDTAVIGKYYRGKGVDYKVQPLTPPPSGQGFQVHYGPVILAPNTEVENHIKHNLNLPDSLEVNRINLDMNKKASHHFLLYMFAPGDEKNYADGLRSVNNSSNSPLAQAAQTPLDVVLPTGTAYRWRKDAVLDMNLHTFNRKPDSVVMTDVRFNVYTQPYGTAQAVMYSEIKQSIFFYIPNNNTDTKLTMNATFPGLSNIYIWTLSSHTHKYGVDFDIFKRNAGGSKGEQLFEGYYDFNYTFNQGYYDWQHPPIRHFEPFYQIKGSDGLIMEGTYRNNGPNAVGFGVTTDDEMFLMFVNYTTQLVTSGTNEVPGLGSAIKIYPNPSAGVSRIDYELKEQAQVSLELYNMLGDRVAVLLGQEQDVGKKTYMLDTKSLGCSTGIYLLKLEVNGKSSTQKLVVTE